MTQKIWSAAIIAAALCAAPVATAQSNNCADLENPKKLQNLEYEKQLELYGDCPLEKIYTSEAILSEWKLSHVDRKLIREMLQSQTVELLMHFRYGLYGEDGTVNDDAMREFQASRGEPATGTLTLRQADDLRKMEQTLLKKPSNVWLYGGTITFEKEDKPKVTMVGNSLFIEGSWWLEGSDRIAQPLNKHEYNCYLPDGICQHAEIYLEPLSKDQLLADLNLDQLKISRVALPIVEIVPFDDSSCRRPVITVNVESGEVFEVTTQIRSCSVVPDLKAPRVARLRSSAWQSEEYREEAKQELESASSPRWLAMQSQVKSVRDSLPRN